MSFPMTPRRALRPVLGLAAALTFSLVPSTLASVESDRAAEAIAPLLDDATYLVLHADLSNADPGSWVRSIGDVMRESAQATMTRDDVDELEVVVRRAAGEFEDFATAFTAAGGRDCYLLATFHAFGQPRPFLLAAPTPEGADADAIAELMAPIGSTAVVRGCVIAGAPPVLDAVRAAPASPRAELAQAWADTPDGTVRAALIPAPYTRRVLAEFVPELPAEMGGGATAEVVAGVQWASATMRTEPELGATLLVQSSDDDAAIALRQALRGGLEFVVRHVTRGEAADPVALAAALTPSVHGDTLTLDVDRAGARTIINCVRPPLKAARDRSLRLKSMTQIRQIAMAVHIHADAHDGAWPEDIERLAQREQPYIQADALVNPRDAKGLTGTYTYVRPALAISSPKLRAATTVLVYETHDAWPPDGLCVGFIDGHVEWLVSEAKFRSLLEPNDD